MNSQKNNRGIAWRKTTKRSKGILQCLFAITEKIQPADVCTFQYLGGWLDKDIRKDRPAAETDHKNRE